MFSPQSVIDSMYKRAADLESKAREFAEIGIAQAEAEREFKKALSRKMLEFKSQGNAISACEKLANGDDHIADLKFEMAKQTILLDANKRAAKAVETQIDVMRSDLSFKKHEFQTINSTQPT